MLTLQVMAVLLTLCGCAGPGPKWFPPVATRTSRLEGGGHERGYDTDKDGVIDYFERENAAGRVVTLHYSGKAGSIPHTNVVLDALDSSGRYDLIILLDSVPLSLVDALWRQGRFRLFYPPVRTIAPFPVMTDVCFNDLMGLNPTEAMEAEYYTGAFRAGGILRYFKGENSQWLSGVDYHLDFRAHAFAYTWPHAWFDHELRRIEDLALQDSSRRFVGYCVGTSAVGAHMGRNGHQEALIRLDQFCQSLVYQTRGRIRITLVSDHGHNLAMGRRIPLSESLQLMGYRVCDHLEYPGDVVSPEFGMVTCAAIYTLEPARVAADVVGLEGIDLTAYRATPNGQTAVVVLSKTGRAHIERNEAGRFAYITEFGDPLQLQPVIDRMRTDGTLDEDGFAADGAWLTATHDHLYPDAMRRLWRAFHGLIEHVPDILISVEDGWYCGSPAMAKVYELQSAHGSLRYSSSSAFIMTMAGELPPVLRMDEAAEALESLGVNLR